MRGLPQFMLLLAAMVAASASAPVRAQSQGTQPAQNSAVPQNNQLQGQPSKNSASPQSPPSKNAPQAPAGPAPAAPSAKPAAKPHKVYTNDDFDLLPNESGFADAQNLLDQLNDCDRHCFEQVGREAGATTGNPAKWKETLFDSIEKVKADQPWQDLLRQMIKIQAQTCDLQGQKAADMHRLADPNNVTPNELAVDREYAPKFAEVRQRLNAVATSADVHIAKNTSNGLQAEFMRLQMERIVHVTCNITVNDPPPAAPDQGNDPNDP